MKLTTKKKETKISSIKNASRKPREVKPKVASPDIFYATSNRSYSWCDKCDNNTIHAVNSNIITCIAGHTRVLEERTAIVSKKEILKKQRELRKAGNDAPVLFLV